MAILTIRRSLLDAFHRYEEAAVQIMARHGGAIERALVLDHGDPDVLRELHIVRFPDAAAWAAYRADPELARWKDHRAGVVLATELWPATEGPGYCG